MGPQNRLVQALNIFSYSGLVHTFTDIQGSFYYLNMETFQNEIWNLIHHRICLLYTSDAADE